MFLSLPRNRDIGKLSQLRKDNGENLTSPVECANHIVSFYENLYKKSPSENFDYNNVIENFLGEDICSSRIVTNSKLTEAEKKFSL